jgi:pimeloyl-ACP methyl ester carboxylesterase
MLYVIAFAYALLVIAVYIFQRGLIYFPTSMSVAVAETTAASAGFAPFRNPAGEIIGWKLSATNAPAGTVLIFHGNAGCALDRDYFAEPICRALPLEVVIVEYPGYGPRNGSPNLGSILATAEAALALLPTNRPVYLVSESIGAGAAAHLARKFPARISGLTLFVPYDDLGDVAQNAFPFLPAKWLLRDRFRPADWIQDYHGPVQIVLAGADEIIPTKRGQSLHDRYAGPKRLQIIPGARHNDVAGQPPEWWRQVFAYFEQNHR